MANQARVCFLLRTIKTDNPGIFYSALSRRTTLEMADVVAHDEFVRRLPEFVADDWRLDAYFRFQHARFGEHFLRLADFVRIFKYNTYIERIQLKVNDTLILEDGHWHISGLRQAARGGLAINVNNSFKAYGMYADNGELDYPIEAASGAVIETLNRLATMDTRIAVYVNAPQWFELKINAPETTSSPRYPLRFETLLHVMGQDIVRIRFQAISHAEVSARPLLLFSHGAWNPSALSNLAKVAPGWIFVIPDDTETLYSCEKKLNQYAIQASVALSEAFRRLCQRTQQIDNFFNIPQDFQWHREAKPFVTVRLADLVEAFGPDILDISLMVQATPQKPPLFLLRHGEWDTAALEELASGTPKPIFMIANTVAMIPEYAATLRTWVHPVKQAFLAIMDDDESVAKYFARPQSFHWPVHSRHAAYELTMTELLDAFGSEISHLRLKATPRFGPRTNLPTLLSHGRWNVEVLKQMAQGPSTSILIVPDRETMIFAYQRKLQAWFTLQKAKTALGGLRRRPDTAALPATRGRRRSRSRRTSRSRSRSRTRA